MLLLVLAILPGIAFLASVLTISRWGLSTARSLFIVLASFAAAIIGMIVGNNAYVANDRSGDASALTAAFFFGALVCGPISGTVLFWLGVGFSRAYQAGRSRP